MEKCVKFIQITNKERRKKTFCHILVAYSVAYPEVNLGIPRARSASVGKSAGSL